jgi:hypothetical protein
MPFSIRFRHRKQELFIVLFGFSVGGVEFGAKFVDGLRCRSRLRIAARSDFVLRDRRVLVLHNSPGN